MFLTGQPRRYFFSTTIVDFNRIRTQIIETEGKHADPLTTTRALTPQSLPLANIVSRSPGFRIFLIDASPEIRTSPYQRGHLRPDCQHAGHASWRNPQRDDKNFREL